jgi:hypothetical protein
MEKGSNGKDQRNRTAHNTREILDRVVSLEARNWLKDSREDLDDTVRDPWACLWIAVSGPRASNDLDQRAVIDAAGNADVSASVISLGELDFGVEA